MSGTTQGKGRRTAFLALALAIMVAMMAWALVSGHEASRPGPELEARMDAEQDSLRRAYEAEREAWRKAREQDARREAGREAGPDAARDTTTAPRPSD